MPSLDLEAFAHIVAHDLGAPIRGISIHLKLLERELPENAQTAERIALLQDRLRRLDTMVQQIRGFSKAIVASQDEGATPVAAAAQEAFDRLEVQHDLRIEGDAVVAANRLLVDAMVGELLRNAVVHDDRTSGTVRLRIADEDPVTIVVEDDGPGLPADTERMMEPFTKGGAFADQGRGTGLALTRLMAEQVGGSLELESGFADGRGLRATLRLPRA